MGDKKMEVSSELKPDATSKKPEIYAEKMQTNIPVRMHTNKRRAFPFVNSKEIANGTAMQINMFSAYIIR
jgi:hypothetical protein